jgi:hypothetical protein
MGVNISWLSTMDQMHCMVETVVLTRSYGKAIAYLIQMATL